MLTSKQRVQNTMVGAPVDRPALFLPFTLHGATEVGLTYSQYFSSATAVVEGQLRLREKYSHDILYPFFYAAAEHEAFGGQVSFHDDGPPTSAGPLFESPRQITAWEPPDVKHSEVLARTLDTIFELKRRTVGNVPIVSVVMAPTSLPVMQLGFGEYLTLWFEQPELCAVLHEKNRAFTVAWANAQLQAGADVVGYFDPVLSPTIITEKQFHTVGLPLARRTIEDINGPIAGLLASGLAVKRFTDFADIGASLVGVSSTESISEAKKAAAGRVTVLGNLNGLEMCHWTADQAYIHAASALAQGGTSKFILSDSHGEIPSQVRPAVLDAIVAAVADYKIMDTDIHV